MANRQKYTEPSGSIAKARPLSYRPDIDGLRAIAVALVLVFHFSLIPAITAGFVGVDIFFVISGFLITTILKRELDQDRFNLLQFYVNRIRRLAPALFVVLLLTLFTGSLFLFPSELEELSIQVLASQLYIANIYYWKTISYFGLQAHDAFLLHTWSLAVEEQFYLVYPAFLLLLHRFLRSFFWQAILTCLVLSFALSIWFMDVKPEATFYLLPTRSWELMTGALVSLAAAKWTRAGPIDEAIGCFGVILIVASAVFYQRDFHFPGFYALLPTMGAACLILSGRGAGTTVSRLISVPPIVYIGRISYSLYLVHWPVNVLGGQIIDDYTVTWHILLLLLSVTLAGLIYHFVENPIRSGRMLTAKRKLLLGYATGLLITASISAAIGLTSGIPQRFPDKVVELASHVNDKTEPLPKCLYTGQRFESSLPSCEIGVHGNPKWLVYGDSHAHAAHAVFDKWLKDRGETGALFFLWACPPLSGIHTHSGHDDCYLFNEEMRKFIEAHREFTNIVLVSTWRDEAEGLSTSSDTLLTKQESLELFSKAFYQTAKKFRELGRQVYVWEPVPGARKNVPIALARGVLEKRSADIEVSRADYMSSVKFFFDALGNSRAQVNASFSPSSILCATGSCVVTDHADVPLYSDNGHMTKSTADYWVQVLQKPVAN
jgi:peptidoglycan/LPS O-acetylase OafA/YrhL